MIVDDIFMQEFIFIVLLNISDLCAVFLVCYTCLRSKKKKRNNDNDDNSQIQENIIYIPPKKSKSNRTKYFNLRIINICCLDFISRSAFFIFYFYFPDATYENISNKVQIDIIIYLDIFARYLFSRLILKKKFYRHQIVAIIALILVFLIFLFPFDILSIVKFPSGINIRLTCIYLGIVSIRGVLFPLEDTIIKLVLNEDYVQPETLMFKRGLFELPITTILLIIIIVVVLRNRLNFVDNGLQIFLVVFIYTFLSFLKAYFIIYIIYYFSSQSVSFLIIIESLIGSIIQIKNNLNSKENFTFNIISSIIEIIVVMISFFFTLVYDEIIIIKKCRMDKDVRERIIARANLEIDNIGEINVNEEEEEGANEEESKNNSISNSSNSIYE